MRASNVSLGAVSFILLSLSHGSVVLGQVSNSGDPQPPVEQAQQGIFPRIRLTYYPTSPVSRKEIAVVDLTEWTAESDVFLEYQPNNNRSFTAPTITQSSVRKLFSEPQPRVRQGEWKVRYEPAATEGQSRLFVTGFGRSTGRVRIFGEDDMINVIFLTGTGWYELGAEARYFRHWQQQNPNSFAEPSIPTRSQ